VANLLQSYSIADFSWLLSIYNDDEGGANLAIPPIVTARVWSSIESLQINQKVKDQIDSANYVVSLAGHNQRYREVIVEEGVVSLLLRLLKDGGDTHSDEIMTPKDSPFSKNIVEKRVSSRVKLPPHIKYDGTTDPREHIAAYEGHMYLQPYSTTTWCKYFPTTLTGVAQTWFLKQKPGSIEGYHDLVKKFRLQFISNYRKEKSTHELMAVTQGKDESLRDFMARFTKEATMISCVKADVALFALQSSLRPGEYRNKLLMKQPATLEEAYQLSEDYIRTEEWNTTVASRQDRQEDDRGTTVTKGKKPIARNESPPKLFTADRREAPKLQPKYETYAPLLETRSRIFALSRADVKWEKPRRM
ncbi:hypothetical protein SOVF_151450, partial [Spinacia oleracea]